MLFRSVELASAKMIIDTRLDKIIEKIEEGYKEEEILKAQMCENYESRAKMIALMISEDIEALSDENFLEEMRIAINADEISVTNSR